MSLSLNGLRLQWSNICSNTRCYFNSTLINTELVFAHCDLHSRELYNNIDSFVFNFTKFTDGLIIHGTSVCLYTLHESGNLRTEIQKQ